MRICLKKSKDQFIRTSHISLWRRAKDPRLTHFGPLTQFTRDHRTLNQPRACSRWQLQAAEWTVRTAV
jgi:hypothetical protein